MPAAILSAPAEERHLYWLDWLRFLAAFAVVVDHTHSFNWISSSDLPFPAHPVASAAFISLCTLGKQAVVVFFVLSGWLVGGHTIRKLRTGHFDAAAYAADRVSRVYVPLVPALLFSIAIVRGFEAPVEVSGFAVCLVGLQDILGIKAPSVNAPLWTLGYEVWFYVLAGCAAVACRKSSGKWLRTAGVAGSALAVGICVGRNGTYLVCWLLGAVGFWVRDRIAAPARPWAALAGVIIMAAGSLVYQIDNQILPGVPPDVADLLPTANGAQLVVGIGALLLIASVVAMPPSTRVGRWIEGAGARLATFSYTLYLIHFPLLFLLVMRFGRHSALTASSLWQAATWIMTCVGVALGMYALFEAQTPRVRRWLRARLGGSGGLDVIRGPAVLAARA